MAAALRVIVPMQQRWRISAGAVALLLAVLVGTPLVWVLVSAIAAGLDTTAWHALFLDPQLHKALGLTLWTGLAATSLSLGGAAWLLSGRFPGPLWQRTVKTLSPLLAVPHAAFAIGFAFLIAPSGWLLRGLSPWATGFDAPPPWPTTQDPWGLGLIAVLVAKEIPFLLWAAATQLQRADVAARLERDAVVARSLGYSPKRAWWRVLWPQLWPRLTGPALAVLAYSLTVVDMALVIGPTSPPTLAVLAWQWLLDADVNVNAQGAAAAWLLAGLVGGVVALLWYFKGWAGHSERAVNGDRGSHGVRFKVMWFDPKNCGFKSAARVAPVYWGQSPINLLHACINHTRSFKLTGVRMLFGLYAAVLFALAVGSLAGVWPFPQVWPERLSLQAWASVASSADTLTTTLWLGLCSSGTALLWAVAWLECAPPRWDAALRRLIYLPLMLPSVLWVIGLHRLCLAWGLDAQWSGLWLAHGLAVLPYVLIALSPAYLGFDVRYGQIAASLRKSRWAYLWHVKWPLLKAALAGAFAVGFAVSVAQYLPTLFIGAGRFATVTTEAVTLASGAQRSLVAAYAGLQGLLPALVFAVAAGLGRPRRFVQVKV